MKKIINIKMLFALMLLIGFIGVSAQQVQASHFRGVTITWSPTGTPGEVEFRFLYSQRTSYGVVTNVTINFGDGTSGNATGVVTSTNAAEDYYVADLKVRHTYGFNVSYTAQWSSCCRIDGLVNGGSTITLQTTVTPRNGNRPPVSSIPTVVTVPSANLVSFTIPASDSDGDRLRFRLATTAENGGVNPPVGLGIDANTGVVTWNTTSYTAAQKSAGQLFTTQVMVEDLDANGNVKTKTPVDFIIKFVGNIGTPPTLVINPAGPLTVSANSPVSFTVTGTDPDANARVTLNGSGLPSGATMTPAIGAQLSPPVTSTFNWTPTLAQAGPTGNTYVINFTATDENNNQALKSITINVLPVGAPTAASHSINATAGVPQNVVLTATDPNGLVLTFSITGSPAHGTAVLSGSPTCSVSGSVSTCTQNATYTATNGYSGADLFTFRANNGVQNSNAANVSVTVAAQTPTSVTVTCPASVAYTGSAQTPCSAVATGTGGFSQTLSVVYTANTNTGIANASASYAGDVSHSASSGSTTFVISKATSSVTVTCTAGAPYTYSGSAQTPCTASVFGAGGLSGSLPVSYSANTDAGTALAEAIYGGDANHTGNSGSSSFVIAKAESTVTVTASSVTFDGSPHGGTAAATGINDLNESLVVTYVGRNLTVYAATTDAPTNAGDYTASAAYAGTDNYTAGSGSSDYTIGKALSTTTVTCAAGPFVYSGSGYTPCNASVIGDGGLSQALSVLYADNVHAGTATASANFAGDDNHFDSSNAASFAIAKADQTIIFGSLTSTTFGAADFSINALASSGLPVSLTVTPGSNCTLSPATSPSNVHITGAGTCSITGSQGGNGDFNAATDVNRSFSIAKASQVITFAPLSNLVFGAADFTVNATGGASGNPVTFAAVGNCTVSGTTVHITGAGTCTIVASQTGNANYDPGADVSRSFNIAKASSALTVSAPAYIANGGSVTISGVLTGVANAPLGNRTVTFSIGSGTGVQSCTTTTTITGAATCTVSAINQPLGPNLPVTAYFGGDGNYLASSGSTTSLVFAYATGGGGAFVIGDRNAAIGQNVTFWGSQWAKINFLTGGAAPNSFKGFANRSTTTTASCGATWTTDPGNSSNPPTSVPSYMAVIVSSRITNDGSIISGNTTKVVIVKTNAGYQPNPGNAGTGTVVGVLCQ